ncbi:MAG: NAD-dependent epimerase [Ahrensia sp.]|nr:NAD-dependent epimerase [Ahrensia sp.]
MKVLVTGAAGFIGAHVAKALIEQGHSIVGLDNLNSYYDPALKRARLDALVPSQAFEFHECDLADEAAVSAIFERNDFDRVIHLGAQAGVRYSIDNPQAYAASNLNGFLNILEACRRAKTPHLVFASSSSVYGANTAQPFSTAHSTEHPVSLYAATKKANEMMAHSYAHLYDLPVTGLRFFTVYGPWGRPDMAYWSFTKKIMAGDAIDIFNNGHHARDFTYIDDVVEGVVRVMDHIAAADENWDAAQPHPATSSAPYRIFNIGNSQPVALMDFIAAIEKATGQQAVKNMLPMQQGDVAETSADVSALQDVVGFAPDTPLEAGIARFVAWYREFHGV